MANKHNIGFIVDDNKVIKKVIDYSIIKIDDEEKSESFAAQYVLKNSEGDTLGVSIDIPKDKVVENAELKTVEEEDVPYPGAHIGDKYIDITFENHETHVYIPVQDLVDIYYGDEETVHVENHIISSAIWEKGEGDYSVQMKNHTTTDDAENFCKADYAVNTAINTKIYENAKSSFAEGKDNIIGGVSGTSVNTTPDCHESHIEGGGNSILDQAHGSHAEGYGNEISAGAMISHVEGTTNSIKYGSMLSHVEGSANHAHGGILTHIEGGYNVNDASSKIAHIEGTYNNSTDGATLSHIEGTYNTIKHSVLGTHVEGSHNIAKNYSNLSHIEGTGNTADISDVSGDDEQYAAVHIEGVSNTAEYGAVTSHTEGRNNTNQGYVSHIEGASNSILSPEYDTSCQVNHIEGAHNIGIAIYGSHIEGTDNTVNNALYMHLEGVDNEFDFSNIRQPVHCHIEGYNHNLTNTDASYIGYLHVEGMLNCLLDRSSFSSNLQYAESCTSVHAEGTLNKFYGNHIHVSGMLNQAIGDSIMVTGKLNSMYPTGTDRLQYDATGLFMGGFVNQFKFNHAIGSFIHGYNNIITASNAVDLNVFGFCSTIDSEGTFEYKPNVDFTTIFGELNNIYSNNDGTSLNHNFMTGMFNTIKGGSYGNTVMGNSNVMEKNTRFSIIGGQFNSINRGDSSIVFGVSNTLIEKPTDYQGGNIILGQSNTVICGDAPAEGGGGDNFVQGYSNRIEGCDHSTVIGGEYNSAYIGDASIIGSYSSSIEKYSSGISSGSCPRDVILGSTYSHIQESYDDKYRAGLNGIYSSYSSSIQQPVGKNVIIGGIYNNIQYTELSMILGGHDNTIGYSTSEPITQGACYQILGGAYNKIGYINSNGYGYQTIIGGLGNEITNGSGDFCSILGGQNNFVGEGSHYNTIVSGMSNKIYSGPGDFGLILSGYYNEIKSTSPYSVVLGGCFNTVTSGAQCNLLFGNFNKIENGGSKSILFGEDNYATVTGSYIEGMGNVNYGIYSHVEGIGELPVTLEGTATTNVYKIKFSNSTIIFTINDLIHEGNYIVSGSSHGAGLGSGGVKILGVALVSSSSGTYYTVTLDHEIDTSLNWFVKGGNTTPFSHVEGVNNVNHGRVSHIEGQGNYNTGEYSHISGQNNINYAPVSFIGGCKNIIYGTNPSSSDTYGHGGSSAVFGNQNIVNGEGNFAVGILNRIYDSSDESKRIGVSFVGGVNNTCNSRGGFVMGNSNYAEGSETINVLGRNNTVRKITYETSSGYTSTSNPDCAFVTGTSNRVFGSTHNTFVQGVNNRLNDFGNVETYEPFYQTTNSGYTNTSSTYWEFEIKGEEYSYKEEIIKQGDRYVYIIDGERFEGIGQRYDTYTNYIGNLNGTYISYNRRHDIFKIRFDGSNHSMTTTKSVTVSLSGLIDKTVSVGYSQTFGNSHMICGPVYDLYTFGIYNKILCDGDAYNGVNKVYKGDVSYCAIFGDTNMLKSGRFHNDYLMGVGNTLENVSYATVFGNSNTIKNITNSSLIYGTLNNIQNAGFSSDGVLIGGSLNQIDVNNKELCGSIVTGSGNHVENARFVGSIMHGIGNSIIHEDFQQSLIFGNRNHVGGDSLDSSSYAYVTSSLLSGEENILHQSFSSIIFGKQNHIGFDNDTWYGGNDFLYVNGETNKVYSGVAFGFIQGKNNEISNGSQFCTIFGLENTIDSGCVDNTIFGFKNTIVGDCTQTFIEGACNTITGAHASHAEGEDNFITNHVSHAEGCKHNIFGAYSHSEGFGGQKLSVTVFDASTNKYRIEFDNSAVKTSANTVLTIGSMLVNGTSQTVGISDVIRITNIEYDNGYVYTTDTTLDLTNDVYMAEGVTNVASHSEGISNTVHAIGSHAEGISNFVISSNGSHVSGISNVINSTGRSDAIIAGTYNSITGTAENTVVIGGHNIEGTESNTVYIPSLVISNTTDDKEVKLTVDSEGFLTVNINGTSYYVSISTEKPGEDVLTPAEVSEIYDNTQPNDND